MVASLTQYRLFDENILLMSEIPSLEIHLTTFLKGLALAEDCWKETTIRLAFFNAPKSHTVLCCPEVGFVDVVPIDTRAYLTFRSLMRILAFNGKYPHYPLHACCVADKQGRAILIAGMPTAGKTSLTAALLQRGFSFAGDDQAYLLEDGTVLSFPVGSGVSENTFGLIPELEPLRSSHCRFRVPQGWEWTVYYGDIFPSVPAYVPLEVSNLFFVTPNFGSESRVNACTPEAAIWHFLNARHVDRRAMAPLGESDPQTYDRSLRLVQTLCRKAGFYEVLNGDLHATADLIAETIGN
jgi:hypothetical protein